jgi:hypothetical protein
LLGIIKSSVSLVRQLCVCVCLCVSVCVCVCVCVMHRHTITVHVIHRRASARTHMHTHTHTHTQTHTHQKETLAAQVLPKSRRFARAPRTRAPCQISTPKIRGCGASERASEKAKSQSGRGEGGRQDKCDRTSATKCAQAESVHCVRRARPRACRGRAPRDACWRARATPT